jgi:hypothetical protein
MISEDEILLDLDNSNRSGTYSHFIPLGHPYSYLIDCRLNIFVGDDDRWAIVAERLGYNVRGGAVDLEIDYFGNCLTNLEEYNGQKTNNYLVYPIDHDSFYQTTDGFDMYPEAVNWLVRDKKFNISINKQDYTDNSIELDEDQIAVHEAARLAIINQKELMRATDPELYKSIPHDLKKILVLDEWFHKDYNEIDTSSFSDDRLKTIYEFNKQNGGLEEIDFSSVALLIKQQETANNKFNENEWNSNRPSCYETWQLLAKVIATGDISFYKPTLKPNTHWINWPESGSL